MKTRSNKNKRPLETETVETETPRKKTKKRADAVTPTLPTNVPSNQQRITEVTAEEASPQKDRVITTEERARVIAEQKAIEESLSAGHKTCVTPGRIVGSRPYYPIFTSANEAHQHKTYPIFNVAKNTPKGKETPASDEASSSPKPNAADTSSSSTSNAVVNQLISNPRFLAAATAAFASLAVKYLSGSSDETAAATSTTVVVGAPISATEINTQSQQEITKEEYSKRNQKWHNG